MREYLEELINIIEQYRVDCHLETFNKKLQAVTTLIEIEAKIDGESSVSAADFADSIVNDFLSKTDDLDFTGTGLASFDRVTGGFQNGDFLIIAGLECTGKTVLMIEIANHWASKSKHVGFLSLEMSAKSITKKFLANVGRLSPGFFNRERGSKEANSKLQNAVNKLIVKPIYIYENPNLHLNKLIAQIKKLVTERKVQIVFVDYLELIIVDEFNKCSPESRRAIICRQFKQLAADLNIVLIVSSQLASDSYNSANPRYCDLVAKGAIEPNTDTVIVHRPEYFVTVDRNNQPTKDRMELIIAKYSTDTFIEAPVKTAFEQTAIVEINYTHI